MKTERPCAQCGERKLLVGRNLCSRCYQGLRNVGRLDRYPAVGQLGRPPGMRQQKRRQADWSGVAKAREQELAALRERLEAAELVVQHARKWGVHDGGLAYAIREYEEAK